MIVRQSKEDTETLSLWTIDDDQASIQICQIDPTVLLVTIHVDLIMSTDFEDWNFLSFGMFIV